MAFGARERKLHGAAGFLRTEHYRRPAGPQR